MLRMLHRLVVFLLFPCLIADPSFTIAATKTNKQTNAERRTAIENSTAFEAEAIVEPTFVSQRTEPKESAYLAEIAAVERRSLFGSVENVAVDKIAHAGFGIDMVGNRSASPLAASSQKEKMVHVTELWVTVHGRNWAIQGVHA